LGSYPAAGDGYAGPNQSGLPRVAPMTLQRERRGRGRRGTGRTAHRHLLGAPLA